MKSGDPSAIDFELNGADVRVAVPEGTPVLYVLRNTLGLKGTRFGCGEGDCGACTVHVDGQAVTSCNTPAWAIRGKRLTTIEGLEVDGRPHPLQGALLAEQAGQCGYCLDGIIMTAVAFLDANPDADEATLRRALSGNLCRCGVHLRVLAAIRRSRAPA
jgi:nicotinate dehydrogenase subunit A